MNDEETKKTELGTTAREGGFVGREREERELQQALEEAHSGGGRFYLIAGEAGIGKTRLADRVAAQARERGFQVAWGRCWENAEARPYWPWIQILRALLREGGDAARENFSHPAVRPLTQLLPELPGEEVPTRPSAKSGTRIQLFDALTVALQHLVETRPLLLIFDDLHAADEASLLLVRFFASEVRNSAIFALGTYRGDAIEDSSLCADVLAQLPRAGGRIELSGLGETDIATLFETIAGHPPPRQITAAVHRATDGNPLFAHEVIGQFVSKGNIHRPDYSMGFRVPEGAREVIEQRMRRIPEKLAHVLSVAAVIGRDFDVSLLEKVVGTDTEHILEMMSEGIRLGVIREESALGGFRFGHVLMREVLYEKLPAALRMRMHRDVAHAIEQLEGPHVQRRLGELAHHYFKAWHAGDVKKALKYSLQAARDAEEQLAFEEAIHHYQRALRLADVVGSPQSERQGLQTSIDRIERLADEPAVPSETESPDGDENSFVRDGDFWTLAFAGKRSLIKDAKGLHYIVTLLRNPGQEVPALELARSAAGGGDAGRHAGSDDLALGGLGDAGVLLDEKAKREYRQRLGDLRQEIEEAENFNDPERVAVLREEMDFLVAELSAATGLGGRNRKAASAMERARVAVTRAIKSTLKRIEQEHPELGHHLATTVRTGNFCSYVPDDRFPIHWRT